MAAETGLSWAWLAGLLFQVPSVGVQEPLEGGIANAQFFGRLTAGNISLAKALQNSSKTLGETFPVNNLGTADLLALAAGPFHSSPNPFPDQFQFEVGKRGQQV